MGITRNRLFGAVAALTALAALTLPSAMAAAEQPVEAAQLADGYSGPYQFIGSDGDAAPETCQERTSPTGARAYICSSYTKYANGDTDGYYRGTLYGSTFVQVLIDGTITNIDSRPNFRGIWWNDTSVRFRACNATGCGNWS